MVLRIQNLRFRFGLKPLKCSLRECQSRRERENEKISPGATYIFLRKHLSPPPKSNENEISNRTDDIKF